MQEISKFLTANSTVFIASGDGGRARVRPFQFQFEENGRLWFLTANNKEVWAQMQADPWVEISACAPDMTTIRVQGQAVLDDNLGVKRRVLEARPMIKAIYGSAENPILVSFYIQPSRAIIFDFSGQPPRTFTF
jgi:uncharacterized pyridoxamine 5'-phosphate oxidase family protein